MVLTDYCKMGESKASYPLPLIQELLGVAAV